MKEQGEHKVGSILTLILLPHPRLSDMEHGTRFQKVRMEPLAQLIHGKDDGKHEKAVRVNGSRVEWPFCYGGKSSNVHSPVLLRSFAIISSPDSRRRSTRGGEKVLISRCAESLRERERKRVWEKKCSGGSTK